MKKHGGSYKLTKPPDRIYKEKWRRVDTENGRRVVGVTKEDNILNSGRVVIVGSSERGKEGSRSEQPGGNTRKQEPRWITFSD